MEAKIKLQQEIDRLHLIELPIFEGQGDTVTASCIRAKIRKLRAELERRLNHD